MSQTAFVTGGTGFIGINVIQHLVNEGWDVTALHRPTSDLTYLKRLPVTLKTGTVTNPQSLREALPEGTDVVFHLAGDTNLWKKRNQSQVETNVGGSRNMAEVAVEKDVPVFIHTSSTSAWGKMSGKVISEDIPQKGYDSWVNYEYTKWKSEQEVLKISESGMKAVILNPAAVTGPFDKNNWGRLFFELRDNNIPGIPNGVLSVNHVREVAKAHVSAVEHGKNGERYILAGEDVTFSELLVEIARISGVDNVPVPLPSFLLKLYARLQEFRADLTGKTPKITLELVRMMTRKNISYISDKAIKELGYTVIPMKKSVQDCYNWLVEEGYLEQPRP